MKKSDKAVEAYVDKDGNLVIGFGDKKTAIFTESISSVEISRSARNGYTWKIKAYNEDLDQAAKDVRKIDEALREEFR